MRRVITAARRNGEAFVCAGHRSKYLPIERAPNDPVVWVLVIACPAQQGEAGCLPLVSGAPRGEQASVALLTTMLFRGK